MRLQDMMYAALNPPMRALLRSPLHGIASKNLALLCYRGRRSGRRFETPLSYAREGNVIRFLSSHNTRWWTNFKDGPTPVEVEIARRRIPGHARLYAEDSEHLREGVRRFLTQLPRDAVVYGIGLDSNRKPKESEIARTADHVVLVEVEVEH